MEKNPGNGARKLTLRPKKARRIRKNMRPPGLTMESGDYKCPSSVQGTEVIETICAEAGLGHNRPGFLSIGVLEEDPGTLTGTPCLTEDETTVDIRWEVKENRVVVDLYDVVKTIKFEVPAESRAFIPISSRNVPGCGPSVLLHFGQVTFEPIRRTGPRKKKDEAQKSTEGKKTTEEKKAAQDKAPETK
ncbi:MAG TPA: hypothetical protein VNT75_11020 [Symbiobacteriaceae bacterium]|nr:hypothetical protein [Symbiobacteriaceae bacterium]